MDEAQARAILDGMWERLARGAHAALGVDSSATPTEIHAAFRELAKVYHPAKFARCSPDIQKLSNEAFLALRTAHDQATKAAKSAPRPVATPGAPGNGRPGQAAPAQRPGLPASARTTGQVPPLRTAAGSQALPRGAVPGTPAPRGLTPAQGVRVTGAVPGVGRPPVKQPSGPIPALRNEDAEYAIAKEAAARGAINEAAATLEALQAPSDRSRALLSYVRGRQYLAAGNREEAREALFDAKDLDPSLGTIVDAALAEVQRRRS